VYVVTLLNFHFRREVHILPTCCFVWSLCVKDEHRLDVSGKEVPCKVSVRDRQELTVGWRKLFNYICNCTLNFIGFSCSTLHIVTHLSGCTRPLRGRYPTGILRPNWSVSALLEGNHPSAWPCPSGAAPFRGLIPTGGPHPNRVVFPAGSPLAWGCRPI
jgi:hypothetical protein